MLGGNATSSIVKDREKGEQCKKNGAFLYEKELFFLIFMAAKRTTYI